jgi:hypothetical protein
MPILPNVASGNSLETLLDSFLPWEPSSQDLKVFARNMPSDAASICVHQQFPLSALTAIPAIASLCLIWLGETTNL